MPRKYGHGKSGFVIVVVVLVLLFGFSPISHVLLRTVNGSFAPSRYSSLSLSNPSDVEVGVLSLEPLQVILTNHTGRSKKYRWTAMQKGILISKGEKTLRDGQATTLSISLRGATSGSLRVAITGTNIFLTVPILSSGL